MREAEMYMRADQAFTDAVMQIDDRWDEMVPSTPDWTVHELVNHVALNNMTIIDGTSTVTDSAKDVLGDEPADTWTEIAEKAEAAAEAMPEAKAASLANQACDRLLHLWDLNGALGLDQTMDPKLAEFAYDVMLPNADAIRSSGVFSPEVPVAEDADVSAKLLGLSGRDPGVSGGDIHTATGNSRSV